MAAETKSRGRVWEHKKTLLLLEKWGDVNIQLQLKSCTRKKPIWLEIAAYLRAAGYEDRDDGSCKTRREMPHQRRSQLSSTKWTSFCPTSHVPNQRLL